MANPVAKVILDGESPRRTLIRVAYAIVKVELILAVNQAAVGNLLHASGSGYQNCQTVVDHIYTMDKFDAGGKDEIVPIDAFQAVV